MAGTAMPRGTGVSPVVLGYVLSLAGEFAFLVAMIGVNAVVELRGKLFLSVTFVLALGVVRSRIVIPTRQGRRRCSEPSSFAVST
jgi:hypothetical protein